MTNRGWISIHRAITEHPDYFSEKFTRMSAWIDLLILASHKDNHTRVRGIIIKTERGSLVVAQETLAERWRWSRGKVRNYLEELEKAGQIKKTKVSNVINRIDICNYSLYQNRGKSSTLKKPTKSQPTESIRQQTDNLQPTEKPAKRTAKNQQKATINNINNVNNNKHTHTNLELDNKITRARKKEQQANIAEKKLATQCVNWVQKIYPKITQMRDPLTIEQAVWLLRKYNVEDIKRIFGELYNKGATKNNSAYLTFLSFARNDFKLKEERCSEENRQWNEKNKEAIMRGMVAPKKTN